MGAPGFWDEPETAQKTAQAVTQLKEEVETFRSLETRVEDMEVLCELALEEDDESLLPEMEETLVSIRTDVEHLELGMLLNGEYDANNAILTLHAGAGGTEAQDWTSMRCVCFPALLNVKAMKWKCSIIFREMKLVLKVLRFRLMDIMLTDI